MYKLNLYLPNDETPHLLYQNKDYKILSQYREIINKGINVFREIWNSEELEFYLVIEEDK